MKNIIYLLLYLTIISRAISDNSGWEQLPDYKFQKLNISELISICVDEEQSKFYTIHKNKKVYYWDYNTGILIDSLEIDNQPFNFKFSKDAKTIISVKPFPNTYHKAVQIIELNSKKTISEFDYFIPGTIECCNPEEFYEINDFRVNLFDYDYFNNQLNVGIGFNTTKFITGGPPYAVLSYGSCGGSGIYDVSENSVLKKKQITFSPTYDFKKVSDKTYTTVSLISGILEESSSLKYRQKTHTFSFVLLDSNKAKTIISREYEYFYYWEWGKDESESSHGSLTPFNNIYYDNLSNKINDRLIVNYGKKFFFIDFDNEVVTDSIEINNSKANILLSKFYNYFIYFNNNSIYFQNSITKQIDSSIACPIIPDGLVNGVGKGSLIAANYDGQIILYEKITTNIEKEQIFKTNFHLSPNPASDYIEINLNNESSPIASEKVQIFDILGIEVMNVGTGLDLSTQRIDISRLSPGVYFIRIGDKVEKFVKSQYYIKYYK